MVALQFRDENRGVGRHRLVNAIDHRKDFVFDLDPVCGLLGRVAVHGRHRGDHVALVQDLVVRHDVLRVAPDVYRALAGVDQLVVCDGQIGVCHRGQDARHCVGFRRVDALDHRVGVRAPQHLAPDEPGDLDVSAVDGPSRDLVIPIVPDRARPDDF